MRYINSLSLSLSFFVDIDFSDSSLKAKLPVSLSNRRCFVFFVFQRVDVIRRSYRQQLGDAITQIASQHQVNTQIELN